RREPHRAAAERALLLRHRGACLQPARTVPRVAGIARDGPRLGRHRLRAPGSDLAEARDEAGDGSTPRHPPVGAAFARRVAVRSGRAARTDTALQARHLFPVRLVLEPRRSLCARVWAFRTAHASRGRAAAVPALTRLPAVGARPLGVPPPG